MLEYFSENLESIKKWCNTLQHEKTDVLPPLAPPLSRVKTIKNPVETSYALPQVLDKDSIRSLALFELYPGCYVSSHNHRDSSYVYVKNNKVINVPWDGIPYKTTHIVLETNPDAYFVVGHEKHRWDLNTVIEFDVLHKDHWAENPGNTKIKFLYIDYYDC